MTSLELRNARTAQWMAIKNQSEERAEQQRAVEHAARVQAMLAISNRPSVQTVNPVEAARAERDAFKKERGVNARFECNGSGRHNVCGRKCKYAQRVGGIDV